MVPDDGAPVTFFLPAEYRERIPPKHALSAKQVGHITHNITNAFRRGEEKASNHRTSLEVEINNACKEKG
ncbi:hypothetical protein FNYG_07036 [Fusarium nygamai]|uniref:Uncharacterized protein n=1 Tax=Gibberella nygamai TaxID=42673 RepID=A0A2K0WBP3_GIBNY|nr:hypothetical protein FNYG_07036 [Fusarium nygamai]